MMMMMMGRKKMGRRRILRARRQWRKREGIHALEKMMRVWFEKGEVWKKKGCALNA